MIPLSIDHSLGVSLQAQIFDQIRASILSGSLRSGSALPSSRDVARATRLSRKTVVLAYAKLVQEGYLTTRSGAGTFVADPLPDTGRDSAPDVDGRPRQVEPDATPTTPRPPKIPPVRLVAGDLHMVQHGPSDHAVTFWYGSVAARHFPVREWRQLLIENLSRLGVNASGYGTPEGTIELRRAIATHVSNTRAIPISPDQVVVTAGTQDGLNLVSRLFVQPSVRVAVENPCYLGASLVFRSYGANLVPLLVDEHGARTDALRGSGATLAYVTPSHQFPTGVTMSRSRRLELLSWAETTGAYVLEDDYDGDFRYDGPPLAALAGLDRTQSVIYLGTFSKSIGSGLRTGYVIVPPQLIEPMRRVKRLASYGHPWIEQIVLADFIERGGFARHLRRIRRYYAQTRHALLDGMAAHFGPVDVSGSDAGMHVLWTLPPHFPAADRVADIAAAEGVGVYPIDRVGACEIGASGYAHALVLGYALLSPEQARDGIARLAHGLRRAGVLPPVAGRVGEVARLPKSGLTAPSAWQAAPRSRQDAASRAPV